jgi:hypothetical protein
MRREPPQELTAAACVVDVHQDVRAKVRLRSIAQYRCLDLVQIKRNGTVVLSSLIALFQDSHHILLLKPQIKSDGRDTNARFAVWMPASGMLCFPDAIRRFGCDHAVLHLDVAASG